MSTPASLPEFVSADLDDFPGGPFDPVAVLAAEAEVRGYCGWHIAPVVTETQLLDGDGSEALLVRSLLVRDVVRVFDRRTDIDLVGWDWSQAGILTRLGGFPRGPRTVGVELTHGHSTAPRELVAYIAHLAAVYAVPEDRPTTKTVGAVTTSWRTAAPDAGSVATRYAHVLDRYRIR